MPRDMYLPYKYLVKAYLLYRIDLARLPELSILVYPYKLPLHYLKTWSGPG